MYKHKIKSYCLCRKDTENINPKDKTSNSRTMLLSNCAICGGKKSKEAKGLLSNLGIRIRLSKVPILGDFLF